MADNLQVAPPITQGNNTSKLFGGINKEVIKETSETIKEVSTKVSAKADLKEDVKPTITELVEKKVKKEVSKEIDIADVLKSKDDDTKVKITFKKNDFVKNEISKKTADAPLDDIGDIGKTQKIIGQDKPTTEALREQIIAAEQTQQESFTPDDYDMIAEFLIDTMDWGGSSLLMWVAKDKTDSPYTLATTKKQRLQKQLARILIKSSFKMNFTVLFLISLVLAYMKPIKEAITNRQSIKKGEEELRKKKATEARQEKERLAMLKTREDAEIDIKPTIKEEVVKGEKVVVGEEQTLKEETIDVIDNKEEEEKVVIGNEEIKEDDSVDDKKPTEDTKLDDKGNVILDRPQGNPRGRRRRGRRSSNG